MKLELEPRLSPGPNFYAALMDILRKTAQVVNPLVDSDANQAATLAALNIAASAPAFHAYLTADQTVAVNTFTALAFNAEEFDTNGRFNVATGVFQPDVAGYYQLTMNLCPNVATGTISDLRGQIWKNGLQHRQPILFQGNAGTIGNFTGSTLVHFNGTTDYAQVTGLISGPGVTGTKFISSAGLTSFSGFLARRD